MDEETLTAAEKLLRLNCEPTSDFVEVISVLCTCLIELAHLDKLLPFNMANC